MFMRVYTCENKIYVPITWDLVFTLFLNSSSFFFFLVLCSVCLSLSFHIHPAIPPSAGGTITSTHRKRDCQYLLITYNYPYILPSFILLLHSLLVYLCSHFGNQYWGESRMRKRSHIDQKRPPATLIRKREARPSHQPPHRTVSYPQRQKEYRPIARRRSEKGPGPLSRSCTRTQKAANTAPA